MSIPSIEQQPPVVDLSRRFKEVMDLHSVKAIIREFRILVVLIAGKQIRQFFGAKSRLKVICRNASGVVVENIFHIL